MFNYLSLGLQTTICYIDNIELTRKAKILLEGLLLKKNYFFLLVRCITYNKNSHYWFLREGGSAIFLNRLIPEVC
jgi:hypothetical protein